MFQVTKMHINKYISTSHLNLRVKTNNTATFPAFFRHIQYFLLLRGIVIDSITLIGRSLRLAFLLTWSCVLIFASLLTILFFSDVAFFFFFEFWKIIEKTMKHLIIGIVIDSCVVSSVIIV
ncbi:hypothetical protein ACJX0J_007061 [Zea mays]